MLRCGHIGGFRPDALAGPLSELLLSDLLALLHTRPGLCPCPVSVHFDGIASNHLCPILVVLPTLSFEQLVEHGVRLNGCILSPKTLDISLELQASDVHGGIELLIRGRLVMLVDGSPFGLAARLRAVRCVGGEEW